MGTILTFPSKAKTTIVDPTIKEEYRELVSKLQFSPTIETEELADTILKIGNYFNIQAPPPIVNIAQDFGFSVFQQPIKQENESGNIFIGGTTEQVYNFKKVIIASNKEEYFNQRFIIAHELYHYLMDYLSNHEYTDNPGKLFSKPYYNNTKNNLQADKFASELIMPSHLFSAMYIKAVERYYNRVYTISFLSSFFKITKSRVERRILEIMNSFII